MEWEVNSPELTLESVRLANYHYGDVYELWRDCEIRCSHAHLGRWEEIGFQLQLEGGVRSAGGLVWDGGKCAPGTVLDTVGPAHLFIT